MSLMHSLVLTSNFLFLRGKDAALCSLMFSPRLELAATRVLKLFQTHGSGLKIA